MSSQEINIVVNLVVIVFSLAASLFPLFWLRNHNGDYKSGFRLILPGLAQSSLGCVFFGMFYIFRLAGLITDLELQNYARPIMLIFLFTPFTTVLSLHHWKH